MDPARRNLTLALAFSVLAHAVLLSIHFELPQKLGKATERALDVILVNAKSEHRPAAAQARAQASLDGGGNTDEPRRAASPSPLRRDAPSGDELVEAQRRITQMEAQMRHLMAQAKSDKAIKNDARANPKTAPEPTPLSGLDLATKALATARLEAQIEREVENYNKRPRKKNIGIRADEYRFAQYVEGWRQKVERIGNLNYPDAARGKVYGRLVLSVTIAANGDVKRIVIDRPSGHKLLDDAARRIVLLAAPYAAFPPAIERDTDEIEITRAWSFTNANQLKTE